jgi:hypothetical protein
MLRIFISYSRDNQTIVESLANDLVNLGHYVWIDQRLKGGQEWWNEILTQIRGCDLFIFSLSPEIEKSQACSLELNYASALGKLILPVLIADNVSMNLFPEIISKKQYVDYRKRDKDAAIKLFNALQNLPPPIPLRVPLPKAPDVPISYIDKLKEEIVTTKPLSFSEQAEIVTKLKYRIGESKEHSDIRYLLIEFKKRDDLYAKVNSDIDDLLSKIPNQAGKVPETAKYKAPETYQPSIPRDEKKSSNQTTNSKSGRKGVSIVVIVIISVIVIACLCMFLNYILSIFSYGGYYY